MSPIANELTETCKLLLKEKCQEIHKVYACCKQTDFETTFKCSETLQGLHVLLTGLENHCQDNERSNYAARYLANHNVLSSRLVQIIAEAENIHLRSNALDILNALLTNNYEILQKDIGTLKRHLNVSSNFSQLLETIHLAGLKFCNSDTLLNLQAKLLRILATIFSAKKRPELYLNASPGTVQILGLLLSTWCSNSELANDLLLVLNVMCHKKRNCEILGCTRFYDALSAAFKLKKKTLTIISLLKSMSKDETSLQYMAFNQNVFKLLLNFLSQPGKKYSNKKNVMAILYRVTKTEQGLELMKKQENYQCLLDWLTKQQTITNCKNRITIIKAFTILNRTLTKITLNPENNLDINNNASSSEESEDENDSEDDSIELNVRPQYQLQKNNTRQKIVEYLPQIEGYFAELLNNSKSTANLEMFANKKNTSWNDAIDYRVNRNTFRNKHSYPDSKILEEELDNHVLESRSDINMELCLNKFKCAKGLKSNIFNPRIVYNLQAGGFQGCSDALIFDSQFESGNLKTVLQTSEFEYELVLSPDTGSLKGLQWFYFQISNAASGPKYTFNIVNLLKVNSRYNYGMKPLMFSVTDYKLNAKGWTRCGGNIMYYGNNYTNGLRQYRTLSFTLSFEYSNDSVYLAYHYPYTYTRLMTLLHPISTTNLSNIYKRVDKLCTTINDNPVPLLTITASESCNTAKPLKQRPIIFITARVHPGETNSSWIVEGMIKFLLNATSEEACRIRECFIFKIIPMLNVEGVINGNTRCGIFGCDMNRCWKNPSRNDCTEIYYTKNLVEYVTKEMKHEVAAYIDIHGHSRKRFFFLYGCNPKMSWNQEDLKQEDRLESLQVLPRTISKINPHIRLNLCRYRIERNRESTARVAMWREFGIQNSFTLECSYCSGDKNQSINTKVLTEIGANVIAAFGMMQDEIAEE